MANKKLEKLMREPARLFMPVPFLFAKSKEFEFLKSIICQDPVLFCDSPILDRGGNVPTLIDAFQTVYALDEDFFCKFNNFMGYLTLIWGVKVDPSMRAWLWKIHLRQKRFKHIDDHGVPAGEVPFLMNNETTHGPLIEMRLLSPSGVPTFATWGGFPVASHPSRPQSDYDGPSTRSILHVITWCRR